MTDTIITDTMTNTSITDVNMGQSTDSKQIIDADEGDYITNGGTHKIYRHTINTSSANHYLQSVLYSSPVITPLFVSKNGGEDNYWYSCCAVIDNPQFGLNTLGSFENYFGRVYDDLDESHRDRKYYKQKHKYVCSMLFLSSCISRSVGLYTRYENRCFISWEEINKMCDYMDIHEQDGIISHNDPTRDRLLVRRQHFQSKYISKHNIGIDIMNIYPGFIEKYIPNTDCIITYNIIQQHPDYNWDFQKLSISPGIKICDVIEHPEHNWCYNNLSLNPNITWDIVCRYKHIPWNYKNLVQNNNITYDIITNAIKLGYDFGEDWEIDYLSNSNITFENYMNYKEKYLGTRIELFYNSYTFNKTVYRNNIIKFITNSHYIIPKIYLYINEYVNPDRYNF